MTPNTQRDTTQIAEEWCQSAVSIRQMVRDERDKLSNKPPEALHIMEVARLQRMVVSLLTHIEGEATYLEHASTTLKLYETTIVALTQRCKKLLTYLEERENG